MSRGWMGKEITCALHPDQDVGRKIYLFSSRTLDWIWKGGILESKDRLQVREGERTGVGVEAGWSFGLRTMMLVLIGRDDHK